MTAEELKRNLEYTKKKHKDDVVDTFGTNISLMCSDVLSVLDRCIEIPEGATNGDVIMAMFPNVEWFGNNGEEVDNYILDGDTPYSPKLSTFRSWWTTPYKRSDNE